MGRIARPWYSHEKHCYMAYMHRRKIRHLPGEENPTNSKAAAQKLRQVHKRL